jgi:(p)ppGpp synthase/HD superfamily hydrolase
METLLRWSQIKAPTASPSRDWLNFVKSPRARSKIKAWFSKERREEAVDAGRESIARQMRKAGLPLQKIFAGHSLLELAHELRYPDIDALYIAVGDGHVSAASIIEKLVAATRRSRIHILSQPLNISPPVSKQRDDQAVQSKLRALVMFSSSSHVVVRPFQVMRFSDLSQREVVSQFTAATASIVMI